SQRRLWVAPNLFRISSERISSEEEIVGAPNLFVADADEAYVWIARANSCPGKEADHAPGYTTVDFRKARIAQRIECSPVSRHPRRRDGQRCAGLGRRHVQGANLHAVCHPLHVPLPGTGP